MTKKESFLYDFNRYSLVISVKVQLPSGAIETITNYNYLQEKMDYYNDKYNDDLQLIANPAVKIISWKIKEGLSFSQMLEFLKEGKSGYLPNWNHVKIKAQFPDENSKMTAPYLYIESRYGNVPWKETMVELFSEHWRVDN